MVCNKCKKDHGKPFLVFYKPFQRTYLEDKKAEKEFEKAFGDILSSNPKEEKIVTESIERFYLCKECIKKLYREYLKIVLDFRTNISGCIGAFLILILGLAIWILALLKVIRIIHFPFWVVLFILPAITYFIIYLYSSVLILTKKKEKKELKAVRGLFAREMDNQNLSYNVDFDNSNTEIKIARGVCQIDPKTGKEVKLINKIGKPRGITLGSGFLWISNINCDIVSQVNIDEMNVMHTFETGRTPGAICFGDNLLWIANFNNNNVTVIDPNNKIKKYPMDENSPLVSAMEFIKVGEGPCAITYGKGCVWVANYYDGTISIINPKNHFSVKTIRLCNHLNTGGGPTRISISADSIWVTTGEHGHLYRVDPANNSVHEVFHSNSLVGVAAFENEIWLTDFSKGYILRIHQKSYELLEKIEIGGRPQDIYIGFGAAWVTDASSNRIWKITLDSDLHTKQSIQEIYLREIPRGILVGDNDIWVSFDADPKDWSSAY